MNKNSPTLPDELWSLILSNVNGFIPTPLKLSCKTIYKESSKLDTILTCRSILNDIYLSSKIDIDKNKGIIHTKVTLKNEEIVNIPYYNIKYIKDGKATLWF